jgi:hypothetical protein
MGRQAGRPVLMIGSKALASSDHKVIVIGGSR